MTMSVVRPSERRDVRSSKRSNANSRKSAVASKKRAVVEQKPAKSAPAIPPTHAVTS